MAVHVSGSLPGKIAHENQRDQLKNKRGTAKWLSGMSEPVCSHGSFKPNSFLPALAFSEKRQSFSTLCVLSRMSERTKECSNRQEHWPTTGDLPSDFSDMK